MIHPPAELTLEALFDAYFDCRRHKRNTLHQLAFEADLERNLMALWYDLIGGNYRIGRSIAFVVTYPKPREVWAASFRDRIVHHLIYNAIRGRFYARFIRDSYAGLSPDGNVKMYITPCDAGMTWSGAVCTGTRTTYTWNDGSSNWSITGYSSTTTGRANTTGLVSLGTTPSPAPYNAARYCGTLSVHGYADWYLPAKDELNILYPLSNNGTAYGFAGANYYWSSTEYYNTNAWAQRFSDGGQNNVGKGTTYPVRCARR